MSDEVHRISIQSCRTRDEAEDMRHVYAAMLADKQLTDRFRVDIGRDFVRTPNGKTKAGTWDVFLIDHQPDADIPKFLHDERFQFKRHTPVLRDTSLEQRDDRTIDCEDETSAPIFPKGAAYQVGDESMTLPEWAKRMDISYTTLMARLRSGMSLADALTRPKWQRK